MVFHNGRSLSKVVLQSQSQFCTVYNAVSLQLRTFFYFPLPTFLVLRVCMRHLTMVHQSILYLCGVFCVFSLCLLTPSRPVVKILNSGTTEANPDKTVVYVSNLTSKSRTEQQQVPFPRWSGGIALAPLLEGIRFSLSGHLHAKIVHMVYMVDGHARLWRATAPRPGGEDRVALLRAKTMETLAASVLREILNGTKENVTNDYPHLTKALRRGGFAYIANYDDTPFCCNRPLFYGVNGKSLTNVTFPILTLSAPVNCYHSFPIPTYETIAHAKFPWSELVETYQKAYPWSEKKRSVIWRGTATGDKNSEKNKRVQLCKLAAKRPDLVDAKLSRKQNDDFFVDGFNETPYLGEPVPMIDFQKYRGIVDIDGNSWSSRFGMLLCLSSVVLKVQPASVDYFHPQLRPWVHYIPVQSDLSDLNKMAEVALSEDDPRPRRIIKNANRWCQRHLTMPTLARDMARIWETYAAQLYQADPSWGKTSRTEQKFLLKDLAALVSLVCLCNSIGVSAAGLVSRGLIFPQYSMDTIPLVYFSSSSLRAEWVYAWLRFDCHAKDVFL